jgi:DNA modification methylase
VEEVDVTVWQSGDVTLYHGDCLEVLPTLAAGSVDAVVTDPPYGINWARGTWTDDPELYGQMMVRFIEASTPIVDKGPFFVWQTLINCGRWHEWFPKGYRIFAACKGMVQYRPTPVQYSWDPVIFWGDIQTEPSVYKKDWHVQALAPYGAHRERIEHPSPKPIQQTMYICSLATDPSCSILDPFMGSGTTGVACVQTGRRFVGIEIDRDYFDVAVKRITEAQQQIRMPLEERA